MQTAETARQLQINQQQVMTSQYQPATCQPINDPSITSTVLTTEEMNMTSQNHQVMTSQVQVASQHGKPQQQVAMTKHQVLTQQNLQSLTQQIQQNLNAQNIQVVSTKNLEGVDIQAAAQQSSYTTSLLKQATDPPCTVEIQLSRPQNTACQQQATQQISSVLSGQISQPCVVQPANQGSQLPTVVSPQEVLVQLQRVSQQISASQQHLPSTQQITQLTNVVTPQQAPANNLSSSSQGKKEGDTINNQQWIEICSDSNSMLVIS